MKNLILSSMVIVGLTVAAPVFASTPAIEGEVETSFSTPAMAFDINVPTGLTADEDLMIFTTTKNGASVSFNSSGCFPMYMQSGFDGKVYAQAFQCDRGRNVGLSTIPAATNYSTELEAFAIRVSGVYAPPGGGQGQKAWAAVSCAKVPKFFSYTYGPPNPPALNPNGWDVEDTLWIEAVHNAYSNPVTAFSVGYDDNQLNGAGGGPLGLRLAIATRAAAVASEDPGVVTVGAATPCVAATIALRPSP